MYPNAYNRDIFDYYCLNVSLIFTDPSKTDMHEADMARNAMINWIVFINLI